MSENFKMFFISRIPVFAALETKQVKERVAAEDISAEDLWELHVYRKLIDEHYIDARGDLNKLPADYENFTTTHIQHSARNG